MMVNVGRSEVTTPFAGRREGAITKRLMNLRLHLPKSRSATVTCVYSSMLDCYGAVIAQFYEYLSGGDRWTAYVRIREKLNFVLPKHRCHPQFFRILKFLNVDLEASVSRGGVLTELFTDENRRKQ